MSDNETFKKINSILNPTSIDKINIRPQIVNPAENIMKEFRETERRNFEIIADNKRRKERDRQADVDRMNKMIGLLEDIKENKPDAYQKIGQVFNNSQVTNAQNISDNATGYQFNSNSNVDFEEYTKLRAEIIDLADLVNEDVREETNELIELVDDELKSNTPKKGIIKAGLNQLERFVNSVILDPAKVIFAQSLKEQAQEKAQMIMNSFPDMMEKLPEVLDKLG